MKLGVVFPQLQIGADPETVREFAQTAEEVGYHHLLPYDHVLGANPDRPNWDGTYDYEDLFHEPLTLFSYLAGVTDTIRFLTGILILPQRQTALVAKQAAEVDVLSDGRLDLGVGIGWNDVEYEALGMDFHTRGRRIEEQIEVVRELWQHELVTYDGDFHSIPDAGINPLPVQRPIPILMGGTADVVLQRAARLAEGWLPNVDPGGRLESKVETLDGYLRDEGRDPDDFPIIGRVGLRSNDPDRWIERTRAWYELDAPLDVTHLSVNTMYMDLDGPTDHIDTIERYKSEIEASDLDVS